MTSRRILEPVSTCTHTQSGQSDMKPGDYQLFKRVVHSAKLTIVNRSLLGKVRSRRALTKLTVLPSL